METLFKTLNNKAFEILGVLALLLLFTAPTMAQEEKPVGRIGDYHPIPKSILTPDKIETRFGTLQFFDGYPSAETVEAVYEHLDF